MKLTTWLSSNWVSFGLPRMQTVKVARKCTTSRSSLGIFLLTYHCRWSQRYSLVFKGIDKNIPSKISNNNCGRETYCTAIFKNSMEKTAMLSPIVVLCVCKSVIIGDLIWLFAIVKSQIVYVRSMCGWKMVGVMCSVSDGRLLPPSLWSACVCFLLFSICFLLSNGNNR